MGTPCVSPESRSHRFVIQANAGQLSPTPNAIGTKQGIPGLPESVVLLSLAPRPFLPEAWFVDARKTGFYSF